jgi:pyruvate/2-oxoglutarate/acetoin dehydrogenase E1 component
MAQKALAAAKDTGAEVIDPRTVSPLDTTSILLSVKKTGRLLIVDEAFSPCSLGAEIAAQIADLGFDYLDAPIRRINGAFAPTPYSPTLEPAVIPSQDQIAAAIRRLINE